MEPEPVGFGLHLAHVPVMIDVSLFRTTSAHGRALSALEMTGLPADAAAYFESRSSTLRVMRSTAVSPPRRPCDQSVVAAVKTVPPFV